MAMASSYEIAMRRLTLTVTTLALLGSLVSTYLLQYLDNDPLNIRRTLTIYSVFAFLVSALGVYGAAKKSPTLITLFASHLLLDSVLYSIPRLVILNFSRSLPSLACAAPQERNSLSHQHLREAVEYRTRNGTIAERLMRRPWLQSDQCLAWTWTLEVIVLGLAVLLMVGQLVIALKMRSYAIWLEKRSKASARREKPGGLKEMEIR